ncbi:hypothetical protein A2397_02025 [Candidatus Amesbacteria bacterium RIFOXYB1_FULL_44_23]|uniref:Uncharacterized protein n=1 Tax=Candidatus Amesbacteria bacterium RIFOXYB1_FULL_44_23 TaxID=1797263 RepID=A0A1F4ZUB5_9BACT|nr:MAG: hypothetical protein A2397_02025 [Candidatus Amesbacteria bacterium RIFOXYB1_FULL_44_23]
MSDDIKWVVDNAVKLSILAIALSVAYYFVFFLPNKQNQELELKRQQYQDQIVAQQKEDEREQQKILDVQKQAAENRSLLDKCLENAEDSYHLNWRNSCRTRGLMPSGCEEESINLEFSDYQKQHNLPTSTIEGWDDYWKVYSAKKDKCTCSLPTYNADDITETEKNSKDECFKRYPQN